MRGKLTPLEGDVLLMLISGRSSKEISEHLGMSMAGVHGALGRARRRLQARTTAQAVAIAVRRRLI